MPDEVAAGTPVTADEGGGPIDPEIQALADSLTPERLVILPFYHELRNSFVKPERVKLQTEYFWQRWVPLLGPVRSLIVMKMRQYGYYNRHTRELRDECARTYDEIAASIGISTRTLERYFESEPDPNGGPYRTLKDSLLARFIRLRHQYVWRPGKAAPERTTNEYKIAMDEPLTPEDEAAFRLAAARRLRQSADVSGTPPDGHTRQNVGNSPSPPRRRQSVAYAAPPRSRQNGDANSPDLAATQPVVPSSTPEPDTTTTGDVHHPARSAEHGRRGLAGAERGREGNQPVPGQAELARDGDDLGVARAAAPDGPEGSGLAEVVATFEAANERPATRLERQLLAGLAAEFDAAARVRGASGPAWLAAAIVEAVDSGSRFVAPKRLREICRRWAREGQPSGAGRAGPERRSPGAAAAGGSRRKGGRTGGAGSGRSRLPSVAAPDAAASSAASDVEGVEPAERPEPPTFVVPQSPGLTNKQLWAAVLDELRPTCPPGTFATWLKPTRLIGLDGDALVVGVPNSFARQWLAERFEGPVARAVGSILGGSRPIRFEVEQDWLSR